MPKSHRGGQGAAKIQLTPPQTQQQPPQPPNPQQQQDDNTPKTWTPKQLLQEARKNGTIDLTDYNVTLKDLQSMNDDDLHDTLLAISKQDIPDFMLNTQQQKFVYAIQNNAMPQVEDAATFAKNAKGKIVIYNAQKPYTDQKGNTQMTADDIHDMLKYGDLTIQQTGKLGQGIYFTNSQSNSAMYGNRQSAAYFSSNAKIVDISTLKREYDSWVKTHPRSQRALGYMKQNAGSTSWNNSYSQFALLRGYNVIKEKQWSGTDYYAVLDRSALVYSESTKKSGSWKL